MRWRRLLLLGLAGACTSRDGGDSRPTPGTLGVLAFSDRTTGDLVVVDVETGAETRFPSEIAPPGAMSLSPDGSRVAFSAEPVLFERHVLVADVATRAVAEILPGTGEMMARFEWGAGDWFWYAARVGDFRSYVVPAGAEAPRELGSFDFVALVASPVEARYAYVDCVTPPVGPACGHHLIVERPDGSERRVLASGLAGADVLAFTPDGGALLSLEDAGVGYHLIWRRVDGGDSRDLGPSGTRLAISRGLDGGTWVSPDGAEVLVPRDPELLAVRVDGTGERTISSEGPSRAAFTARGDVLFELENNTTPGSDTPIYEYALRLDTGGEVRTIRDFQARCEASTISRTGAYVVFPCDGVLAVQSLVSAEIVLALDGTFDVGFDAEDRGLVYAQSAAGPGLAYALHYATLDGATDRVLGEAAYLDVPGGVIEWAPYDYVAPAR